MAHKNRNEPERGKLEESEETVYAVRVAGTKFTFYKAIIPYDYLMSLGNGLPRKAFTIYRFPDNDDLFSYYDYLIPEERKIIVQTFFQLKAHFTSI